MINKSTMNLVKTVIMSILVIGIIVALLFLDIPQDNKQILFFLLGIIVNAFYTIMTGRDPGSPGPSS